MPKKKTPKRRSKRGKAPKRAPSKGPSGGAPARASVKPPASRSAAAVEAALAGELPALVPQPGGRGALYAGGVPGNRSRTGYADELREVLGEITVETAHQLRKLVAHQSEVKCPDCGKVVMEIPKLGLEKLLRVLDRLPGHVLPRQTELAGAGGEPIQIGLLVHPGWYEKKPQCGEG